MIRRGMDIVLASCGILLATPLVAAAAAAIAIEDGFPVFFRQNRVGTGGRLFRLWKLRSMRQNKRGHSITAGGDARITRTGRVLRRYKLDELPQFWNVLRGDMSFIGPRPEVPEFVDAEDPSWRCVLSQRPGITDFATLVYRNEESLLAGCADPEQVYRERILPSKLALNIEYFNRRSLRSDLKLLVLTARYSLFPSDIDCAQ